MILFFNLYFSKMCKTPETWFSTKHAFLLTFFFKRLKTKLLKFENIAELSTRFKPETALNSVLKGKRIDSLKLNVSVLTMMMLRIF
jgi:hypothetical protein